ncbi:spore coat protein SP96-like isoform X1 [Myripristis murdjan]|uniref:spore coat protein SP96-like isoform X1 n=1 Tax=Myripristis murdjan TaxID=586833 RepID=UPI0011761A30|nr:spore coat protein SP96-like isoform X1 [Myripristis murdjan]
MLLLLLCAACLTLSAGQTSTQTPFITPATGQQTTLVTQVATLSPSTSTATTGSATQAPLVSPATAASTTQQTTLTTQASTFPNTTALTGSVLGIFEAAVQSAHELNSTTIAPVLNRVSNLIRTFIPGANFHISVKNITRV